MISCDLFYYQFTPDFSPEHISLRDPSNLTYYQVYLTLSTQRAHSSLNLTAETLQFSSSTLPSFLDFDFTSTSLQTTMAPLADISRAFGQQSPSAEPISRTMQYRKVTKPLLERQRRARINRCLDELKDILVAGLQNEGENVARLEKADILELTVRHLQKLQQQHNKLVKSQQMLGDDERFRGGFAHCAQEVSRVLATTRGVDIQLGSSIMVHLGHSLNQITTVPKKVTPTASSSPSSPKMMSPRPSSVCSTASSTGDYRPYTPPASPTESQFPQLSPLSLTTNNNSKPWRPW